VTIAPVSVRGQRTRSNLLAAARAVFERDGYLEARVTDVADARAELEARGVVFVAETWDSGVCRFAAFRDPDGNVLILHRRYAPRRPPAGA